MQIQDYYYWCPYRKCNGKIATIREDLHAWNMSFGCSISRCFSVIHTNGWNVFYDIDNSSNYDKICTASFGTIHHRKERLQNNYEALCQDAFAVNDKWFIISIVRRLTKNRSTSVVKGFAATRINEMHSTKICLRIIELV